MAGRQKKKKGIEEKVGRRQRARRKRGEGFVFVVDSTTKMGNLVPDGGLGWWDRQVLSICQAFLWNGSGE